MKKRHKAEEIIRILREAEVSPILAVILKKYNISEQTFYRWRQKYGAMPVDEAKRLKQLEAENVRLKKVVAELALENDALKELSEKKW